jgi:hypothetical protein
VEFELTECLVICWSFGGLVGELIVWYDDWFVGCSVGGFIGFLLVRWYGITYCGLFGWLQDGCLAG